MPGFTRFIPTNKVGYSGANDIVYDDMQVNVGRVRLGATAPTWRRYNHGVGSGVTFDVLGFAVNNYIYFDVQTSHSMKLNTILDCHMHYILPNTTNIGDIPPFVKQQPPSSQSQSIYQRVSH